jgi:RNA polymerase sigma-70 factor, ECF subfamily
VTLGQQAERWQASRRLGDLDDETLLVRARERDTAAFEQLVIRHQQAMYRLALRVLDRPEDAEDALQEALVAAWRQLPSFRGDATFASWLYRIVTTRCLNLARSRARRPARSLDGDTANSLPSGMPTPEQLTTTSSARETLNRALSDLPVDQRVCWVLRENDGLSYDEIAAAVGSTPDAVRGRIHRARSNLAGEDAGVEVTDRYLPCGRDPLQVWDDAAEDRLDAHQQTCRYCQGVAAEYRDLAEPIREWQAETIEAPPALLRRVMTTVRAGLTARNYLPLVSPHGPARLDTATAAAAMRWAADQVDGVRARSCHIDPIDLTRPTRPPDEAAPAVVTVHLSITAPIGVDLLELADEVRRLVRDASNEILGLEIATINIDIVDVYQPLDQPPAPTGTAGTGTGV